MYTFCQLKSLEVRVITDIVRDEPVTKMVILASSGRHRALYAITNFKDREIFITGGEILTGVTNSVLCFDLASLKIRCGIAKMNVKRMLHSGTTMGDNVYAIGGKNGSGYLSSIEMINGYDQLQWLLIRPETKDSLFAARAISLVFPISDSEILICGGRSRISEARSDILVFNTNTCTISKLGQTPFPFRSDNQVHILNKNGKVLALVMDKMEKGACLIEFNKASRRFRVAAEGLD